MARKDSQNVAMPSSYDAGRVGNSTRAYVPFVWQVPARLTVRERIARFFTESRQTRYERQTLDRIYGKVR